MREKPTVSDAVRHYVVLAIVAFLFCCWLGGLAYATEAPGCGNQHYRPRLSQCCPKFCAGEAMPNKCNRALNAGFLGECCGEVVIDCPVEEPSPTPEPTCPEGWTCWPTPRETSTCLVAPWRCEPTPHPTYTPGFDSKGACCAHVRFLYANARHTIIEQKQGDLRDLLRWKKQAMAECRAQYSR